MSWRPCPEPEGQLLTGLGVPWTLTQVSLNLAEACTPPVSSSVRVHNSQACSTGHGGTPAGGWQPR